MTAMTADGLEARVARILAALPGFTPDRHTRSLKCVLVFGWLAGERICVKQVCHPDPVWGWYVEREAQVLAQLPTDLRAPKLRARIDASLVIDELAGTPLAIHRRRDRPLASGVLDSCLALARRVQELELGECALPDASIVATLRSRLLEDPSAPLAWFHDGFDRCETLGIVSAAQASFMHAALDDYPEVRCCHGDMLPRNLLVDEQGRVSACDWECAGKHARDWDLALLWANLSAPDRARIEREVIGPSERVRAFWVLAGFALAREIKFAARAPQARRDALTRELDELLERASSSSGADSVDA